VGQLAGAGLAGGGAVGGGEGDGFGHRGAVEVEELGHAAGDGNGQPGALVPAEVADHGRAVEATDDLVHDVHGGEEGLAAQAVGLGDGEQRAQAVAGVAADQIVVEIEIADERAVGERGHIERGRLGLAEDAGRGRTAHGGGELQGDAAGRGVGGGERAP
jgi:hypothetical protein